MLLERALLLPDEDDELGMASAPPPFALFPVLFVVALLTKDVDGLPEEGLREVEAAVPLPLPLL